MRKRWQEKDLTDPKTKFTKAELKQCIKQQLDMGIDISFITPSLERSLAPTSTDMNDLYAAVAEIFGSDRQRECDLQDDEFMQHYCPEYDSGMEG